MLECFLQRKWGLWIEYLFRFLTSFRYGCFICWPCGFCSRMTNVWWSKKLESKSQAIRRQSKSCSQTVSCTTDTSSVCFKQHFQLRCRPYQIGYLYTSLNNALCAMMRVFLVLLDKLVMTPLPLYFHSRCVAKSLLSNLISMQLYLHLWGNWFYHNIRRMKLQNVVRVGQFSISNALGKSVSALVVRLLAQTGKLLR